MIVENSPFANLPRVRDKNWSLHFKSRDEWIIFIMIYYEWLRVSFGEMLTVQLF